MRLYISVALCAFVVGSLSELLHGTVVAEVTKWYKLHYSDCSNLTKTQHRDSERGCRMGYHEVVGQAHESHFALALKHRTVLSDPMPSLSD
jgi:hypothetical protein